MKKRIAEPKPEIANKAVFTLEFNLPVLCASPCMTFPIKGKVNQLAYSIHSNQCLFVELLNVKHRNLTLAFTYF